MLEFTHPVSRETLIIKELLHQREAAANKLGEARSSTGEVRVLLEGGLKTDSNGGRPPFNESIMGFAYYNYATGGPKNYKTLVANSIGENKLPSLSTVKRYSRGKQTIEEGQLQVESIKTALVKQGLPLAVWLSEDDTKIKSELVYNSKTNEIMGLDLPIGVDGLPVTGAFKFTSVSAALSHVRNNPMSTYLKIVTCVCLQEDGYKFVVLAYGTSSGGEGGQTAGVKTRWKTIILAFESAGIKVYGKLRFF